MTVGVTALSGDAIRGYVRALRQERQISQPKLAEAIHMALRTYKDWETGNTRSLDATYLLRIMRVLKGDLLALGALPDDATFEDGQRLAERDSRPVNPRLLAILADLEPGEIDLLLSLAERMRRP